MNHLLESLIRKAKVDPEPRVYFRICEEYRKLDDVDNVIINAKLGLDCNENHLPLLLALGKAYQEREDYELAIPYYQNVLSLDSANVRANHGLALCFIQLGFAGEAEANMQNLKLLQPEYVEDLQRQINAIVDEPAQEIEETETVDEPVREIEAIESDLGASFDVLPETLHDDMQSDDAETITEPLQEADLETEADVEDDLTISSDQNIGRLKLFLEKIRSQ